MKALKLFKLAIENFMPPNLVLLVDSESHMSEVGATLYKRLHDPNWEIQDSVLEVLNTIAVISEHSKQINSVYVMHLLLLSLSLHFVILQSIQLISSSYWKKISYK